MTHRFLAARAAFGELILPPKKNICDKLMSKKAKDRYQTMTEVAQALGEWLKNPQAFSFSATGPAPNSVEQDPSPRFIMDPLEWLLGRNPAVKE